MVVKIMPCRCVHMWRVFTNLVTYTDYIFSRHKTVGTTFIMCFGREMFQTAQNTSFSLCKFIVLASTYAIIIKTTRMHK